MKTMLAGMLIAGCSPVAFGQVLVVTQTIVSSRTNTLYSDPAGSVSNGAGIAMFAGANAGLRARRAVVYFDLSVVPSGAVLTGAELILDMTQSNSGDMPVAVHRVLSGWGSGTSAAGGASGGGSGIASTENDATWLHRFYHVGQPNGGADTWTNTGGDFDTAVLATVTVGGPGTYSWSNPALTAAAQSWITNPTGNFGLLLKGDEETASSAKKFSTHHATDPAVHPRLRVTYNSVPAHCDADVGMQGGVPGHDNVLDNNDFVVFINQFFAMDAGADFGTQGGIAGHDGLFDNNDFVVFINAFFSGSGCP